MGSYLTGKHAATPSRRRRVFWRAVSVLAPVVVLAAGASVGESVYASFTSTKNVTSNAFSTATVTLTDNESGASMFNVSSLAPSSTGSACIQVKYTGSAAASVKMYVASGGLTGSLGSYLQLKIEQGTGTALNCSDFSSTSTIYNAASSSSNTLATFASSSTSFATGVGSWSPSGANQTMTYRITYLVLRNSYAQGTSASVNFTWEADA